MDNVMSPTLSPTQAAYSQQGGLGPKSQDEPQAGQKETRWVPI